MHQVIGAFPLGSCLAVGFLQEEICSVDLVLDEGQNQMAVWRSLASPCDNEAWRGISLAARPAIGRVRDSYAFVWRSRKCTWREGWKEERCTMKFHVFRPLIGCSGLSSHSEKWRDRKILLNKMLIFPTCAHETCY
jgi:hypothetical protein